MPLQLHLPPCEKCIQEGKTRPPVRISVGVPIIQGTLYSTECDNGHDMIIYMQNRHFEILFELGAIALVDGYFREAVANFAASFERFVEFYVRFIMWSHGVSDSDVSETWKHVSSQSERQLGAFLFLQALENKTSASNLRSASVNFRNSVIHKGHIPASGEVVKFANEVFAYIRPMVHELKTSRTKQLHEFLRGEYNKEVGTQKPDYWWTPETILSLFGLGRTWDEEHVKFENLIDGFEVVLERRWRNRSPGFTNRSILHSADDRPS